MIKSTKNLVWIIIILIVFSFVFVYTMNCYVVRKGEKLEYRDMAAIVSAIIICGTLIVNAINTQINASANNAKIAIDSEKLKFDREKFINDKKILSHTLADGYNSPYMRDCIGKLLEYREVNKGLSEWDMAMKIAADIKVRLPVGYMLNYLEKVAIAYREGICDNDLLKEFFYDIFKLQYKLHENYIRYRQAETRSTNIFDEFVKISKEWHNFT